MANTRAANNDAAQNESPTVLREKEAARFLNASEYTLRAWRCYGGGPPYIKMGRRSIRYRLADLEVWLASGRRAA